MRKKLLLVCCLCCLIANAEDYAGELKEVKEGKRTEAKASWWGYNRKNATRCLQAAINSGVPRLIIDNTGSDWILDRIELVSNQEIILEENVRLVARKGGFTNVRGDSSFINFKDGHDIILRGKQGSAIIMRKKDYQNRAIYKPSEWRHMLDIRGGRNITIRDLRLESSGGDGIYIGNGNPPSKPVKNCSDIHIENLVVDNHHRQGISVITVKNLLIRNCIIRNTGGTPPQAGIDFEPNLPDEQLVNCVVENCTIENNAGNASVVYLVNLNGDSAPVSITYSRCKFRNNKSGGISVAVHKGKNRINPVKGIVKLTDCEIEEVKPLSVTDSWNGFEVLLRKCRIIQLREPVIKLSSMNSLYQVGNLHFEDVSISEQNLLPFKMEHHSYASAFNFDITGDLLVNGRKYDYSAYLNREIARSRKNTNVKPASNTAGLHAPKFSQANPAAGESTLFWSANKSSMMFAGKSGQQITLDLHPMKSPPENTSITLLLFKPGKQKAEKTVLKLDGRHYFHYQFTPDADGLYRIALEECPKDLFLSFDSKHSGQGMYTKEHFQLFKPQGQIYFEVPAKVRKFEIVLWCGEGQRTDVKLLNPAGKCEKEFSNISRTLFFKKRESLKSELWALEFQNAVGEVNVMLTEPLTPIISDRPEKMLRK